MEHQNIIEIRMNETVFTICAALVPILKINDDNDTSALLDLVHRTFQESIISIISRAIEPASAKVGAKPMKQAHYIIDTLDICVIHI